VVEWLHPSIDRANTFNYRTLGDLETLGRLWGYRTTDRVEEAFVATLQLLDMQKEANLVTDATRIVHQCVHACESSTLTHELRGSSPSPWVLAEPEAQLDMSAGLAVDFDADGIHMFDADGRTLARHPAVQTAAG